MSQSTSVEQSVLNIVCSVFDAYSAVLFLPSETGDVHHLVASFSLGDKIANDSSILPGRGLVGWIIRNRQPLLVPNFDQHQSILGYYLDNEESTIKAFMGCPIPTGGALCVDSKRQYSFSDKDHKVLNLFAGLFSKIQKKDSQAISGDIPRYFVDLGVIQDLRFRYKRWPQFLQNYLSTVVGATGFEYGAFASLEVPGEKYCVEHESTHILLNDNKPLSLPMGTGLAGWVFQNDQPVIAEDIEGAPASLLFGKMHDMPDFQAVMCMPIVVNKATRGVLCLASTEKRSIDEGVRSFVRQAVDHMALFLENLYFKTRLKSFLPKATIFNEGAAVYNADHDTALSVVGKE